METEVKLIRGPRTANVEKADAEAQLKRHPSFPKGASVQSIDEIDGRWVAALAIPKVAAPPFGDEGPPSGPPSGGDGPLPDEALNPEGEDDAPKSEGDEKPKDEKSDKGGEKAELGHVVEMLTKIVQALGLDDASGMGADGPEGPTPPPGLDGPPPGADPTGPGGDGKTHTVHERALKPGEAPPGTTPIGSPSFANVSRDHPWYSKIVEGAKEWVVEDALYEGESVSSISTELRSLASAAGCRVEAITPNESRTRVAATIVRE